MNLSLNMIYCYYINKQFEKYVSWKPYSELFAIDAFSISNMKCYCFPPFSVLPTVLHKMSMEKVTGIFVLPNWPTQHYYSTVIKMLIALSVYVHKRNTLLHIQIHKIWDKIDLLLCLLSGDQLRTLRTMLPTYYYRHGVHQYLNNINDICGDDKFSVVDGRLSVLFNFDRHFNVSDWTFREWC